MTSLAQLRHDQANADFVRDPPPAGTHALVEGGQGPPRRRTRPTAESEPPGAGAWLAGALPMVGSLSLAGLSTWAIVKLSKGPSANHTETFRPPHL